MVNICEIIMLKLSLLLMLSSRRCRTLLLIKLLSPCILIKLGAHALLNVNHSYHIDLRAYALHVDLGVDAPHVDFRSLCSTHCFKSHCSTR